MTVKEVKEISDLTKKENIIISSLLTNKECLEYLSNIKLDSDLFADKFNKKFMQTLYGLLDSGIEATESIILDQLAPEGGTIRMKAFKYLETLKQEFPSESKEAIELHIASLRNNLKIKKYRNLFKKALTIAENEEKTPLKADADKIKNFIEKHLYDLEDEDVSDEVKVMNMEEGYLYLIEKMQEALTSVQEESVTSGYDELDAILTGGFRKGTFSMIAARPGMGKTVIMLNMAVEAAKRGKKVLFLSLEMNLIQCFQRMISKIADISGKKIQQPKFMTPSDWKKLESMASEIKDLYNEKFWIEEIVNLTVPQMERKIKLYKKKHDVDIVFVDYAQIMLTKEGLEPDTQNDFAQISGALRRASKTQNVAIIVGSQLNRKVEDRPDKRPMMQDIRNSGAFEQDAGVIIGLYRDAVYNEETETPNELEMIMIKNRFGKANSHRVKFDIDMDKQALYSKAQ